MPTFTTIDPSTGAPLASFRLLTADEADQALDSSARAYDGWSGAPIATRRRVLLDIARLHAERAPEFARTMAREMGKPFDQGVSEALLAASVYEYYADHAAEWLQDERVPVAEGTTAVIRTNPLGPLLGIMPWNFPLYQVARFVAPNLMLGNVILLKHARACAGTSESIRQIMEDAGLPAGVYQNLFLDHADVPSLLSDDRVRGVSFTGSEQIGREIAALAGANLKKCVLELGGSDPFIVFPDADLEHVLDCAERGRFWNAGQVCNGAKRMIVHREIWDAFISGIVDRARQWQPGDPAMPGTRLGPLASARGRETVHEIVSDALALGATVHIGGEVPPGVGNLYPITVLTGVTPEMRAYSEEIFGPVVVAHRFDTVDEAISLANDTPFGLGSSVFTESDETAAAVSRLLEVGMVGINTTIRSQASLPFGGVKTSGLGRELGRLGFDEFANKKVVQTLDVA